MRITFLGTGTSQGVPIINCDCDVCQSDDPRNNRMRCSIMVEIDGLHILVDTSMDMRNQFLKFRFPKIDAVLFTHAHADHIFGLDELRRFNYLQKEIIPVYGSGPTMEEIQSIFGYAFSASGLKFGMPNISAVEINEDFEVKGTPVKIISLDHGGEEVLGFRFGDFAYCTDVSLIPEESYSLLDGLEVLALGALRERPHPKHFSLGQAVQEAEKIAAKKTYLTHMSHILDHEKHGKLLPGNCYFAYDGLILEL